MTGKVKSGQVNPIWDRSIWYSSSQARSSQVWTGQVRTDVLDLGAWLQRWPNLFSVVLLCYSWLFWKAPLLGFKDILILFTTLKSNKTIQHPLVWLLFIQNNLGLLENYRNFSPSSYSLCKVVSPGTIQTINPITLLFSAFQIFV